MNPSKKNRKEEQNDSSADEISMDEETPKEQDMEIQVEFEGRNPEDPDFHDIRSLLQRLFLRANVDLDNLTEHIISQNYVGSVIKQSNDEPMDSNDDDDDGDSNQAFGITTAINLANKPTVPSIGQLRELLRTLVNEHASGEEKKTFQYVMENPSVKLGLLINERVINIPSQISVPLLENLISEMKQATAKNMPYDFTHFILVCKLHKIEGKKKKDTEIYYSNPEEEIIAESAMASFEFSDDATISHRKVLILEASKLPTIIKNIQKNLN